MITVSGQKAAYGSSRALTSRVAPSISRNPACRFYRVKFITPWPTLSRPLGPPSPRGSSRFTAVSPHRCVLLGAIGAATLFPFRVRPRRRRRSPLPPCNGTRRINRDDARLGYRRFLTFMTVRNARFLDFSKGKRDLRTLVFVTLRCRTEMVASKNFERIRNKFCGRYEFATNSSPKKLIIVIRYIISS